MIVFSIFFGYILALHLLRIILSIFLKGNIWPNTTGRNNERKYCLLQSNMFQNLRHFSSKTWTAVIIDPWYNLSRYSSVLGNFTLPHSPINLCFFYGNICNILQHKIMHICLNFPEPEIQVSFSDCIFSVVRPSTCLSVCKHFSRFTSLEPLCQI